MSKDANGGWTRQAVLSLAHIAGMIGAAATPVWVGTTLIGQLGFAPQQAGGAMTLYLFAVVAASLLLASQLHRYQPRYLAALGFAVAGGTFLAMTQVRGAPEIMTLHAVAGLATGVGLTATHAAIGRTPNPHRVFATANICLAVAGLVIVSAAQAFVPRYGAWLLFAMFAAFPLLAAALAIPTFPASSSAGPATRDAAVRPATTAPVVWWGTAGIGFMSVAHVTLFSFLERIGVEHGFGDRMLGILSGMALIALLAPVMASVLQRRLHPILVASCGAVAQIALAGLALADGGFTLFAAGALLYPSVMLFAHTFMFGWLSKTDASGRSVALTPVILMGGGGVGTLLGGAVKESFGSTGLWIVILCLDAAALICYLCVTRTSPLAVADTSGPPLSS